MSGETDIGGIQVSVGADLGGLNQGLDQAAQALASTSQSMQSDLGLISSRAAGVFDGLAGSVARAATSGRSSIHGMVDTILSELSRLAVKTFITKPLDSLFNQLFSGLGFGGGRAAGGAVDPGTAYLVGERGPELFVPAQAGSIAPNGRMGGVTVNIYAQDAQSVMKSETQIAAMLARAAARGQRNL